MRKITIILIALLSIQISAQTTTAFRKNYNQALFDLPGNIVEGLKKDLLILIYLDLQMMMLH